MKVRIMCVFLVAGLLFALSGCKTKENVSEHFTEDIRVGSTEMRTKVCHDERHERDSSVEQTMQTSHRDSLVEKFRERVVVDSVGRVLFKDREYTKERYQGNGVTKADRQEYNRKSEVGQTIEQSRSETDTVATAIRANTVKMSSRTNRWLLFFGLLIPIIVIGTIISKVMR